MCGFSVVLILKRIMTFQSQRIHAFCWTKIKNEKTLIKTKRNRKWKIPQTERQTLCFNSYKNRKLKVKLWWAGARERKKRAFFVPFILSERNFFKIYVLSQYIVYWIHFQDILLHIKKTLLQMLLLLVFKIVKSLLCILKNEKNF